jgi:hypothetical protein
MMIRASHDNKEQNKKVKRTEKNLLNLALAPYMFGVMIFFLKKAAFKVFVFKNKNLKKKMSLLPSREIAKKKLCD